MFTLVEDRLLHTKETKVSDGVHRYSAITGGDYLPLVYRSHGWAFEHETSPYVSNELKLTMSENKKLSNRLSTKLQHNEVGPMMLSSVFQYDKDWRDFIKINNEYYSVKNDGVFYESYIDGEYDFIPLKKTEKGYAIKKSISDGVEQIYREELDIIIDGISPGKVYLDNTVLDAIKEHKLHYDRANTDIFSTGRIPGAVRLDAKEYLPYKGDFIEISANGDDTYILGSAYNTIDLYKNGKSNTYFLIEEKSLLKQRQKIKVNGKCVSKRQVLSGCNDFLRSEGLIKILDKEKQSGIVIKGSKEHLEPHPAVPVFFKDTREENKFLYHFEGDVYFHAVESDSDQYSKVPVFFTLYGDKGVSVGNDFAKISVIKNFDDKTNVLCTYKEASDLMLGSERELSVKKHASQYLDANKSRANRRLLNELFSGDKEGRKYLIGDVAPLFEQIGKKAIFSITDIERNIREFIAKHYPDPLSVQIRDLVSAGDGYFNDDIVTTVNRSHQKAIEMLIDAKYNIMKNDYKFFYNYLMKYGISDNRVIKLLIDCLSKKIKRMLMVLEENDGSNIMLVSSERKEGNLEAVVNADHSSVDGAILGFTPPGDPRDRVFINTNSIFPDNYRINDDEEEKYINLVSETLVHEASHAVSSGDDMFYVGYDQSGKLLNSDGILKFMMNEMLKPNKLKDFIYLTALYLSQNAEYNVFNFASLLGDSNIYDIFMHDDCYCAFVLINNSDTLSLLVRDIADLAAPVANNG